jgi:hypothetical protein
MDTPSCTSLADAKWKEIKGPTPSRPVWHVWCFQLLLVSNMSNMSNMSNIIFQHCPPDLGIHLCETGRHESGSRRDSLEAFVYSTSTAQAGLLIRS